MVNSARLFAWMSALGAVILIAAIYDRMPDLIPVTRWSASPRSPLMALRIPLINLFSLLLIETLVRALLRVPRIETRIISSALFAAVGLKSLIEGLELYLLPWKPQFIPAALFIVIAGGIGIAVGYWRRLIKSPVRPKIEFRPAERIAIAISCLGICAMQWSFLFVDH